MRFKLILIIAIALIMAAPACAATPKARNIAVDTSSFDKNLTADDDTVQKVAEKVDELAGMGAETDPVYSAAIGNYLLISATSAWDKNASDDFDGSWSSLSGVPAGFADGTDDGTVYTAGTGIDITDSVISSTVTDTNTTYTAGTGMSLDGTTFNCTVVDTNTQLSEATVDSYVSNNGYLTSSVTGSVEISEDLTVRGVYADALIMAGQLNFNNVGSIVAEDVTITNALSVNTILSSVNAFSDVDTTGWATGKILKFDASGVLIVGTDETGAGGTITLADLSATSPLSYNNTTGVFSVASGYEIPSTTDMTNFDTAYSHSQAAHAPSGAEVNVNADWNASSGDAQILNKPTIPTNNDQLTNGAGYLSSVTISDIPTAVVSNSDTTHVPTSDNVYDFVTGQGYVTTDNDTTYTAGTGMSLDGTTFNCTVTDTNTQLSEEQVEDYAGGMVTGNTETLITVTYQDADGTMDFVVDNNLANYSNATSGFITSADDTVSGSELDGVFSTTGLLRRTGANTYSTITDGSTNWNTAYGWGNHASAGYLVSANMNSLAEFDTQIGLTGTADGTTYLRGDGSWATPSGAGLTNLIDTADGNNALGDLSVDGVLYVNSDVDIYGDLSVAQYLTVAQTAQADSVFVSGDTIAYTGNFFIAEQDADAVGTDLSLSNMLSVVGTEYVETDNLLLSGDLSIGEHLSTSTALDSNLTTSITIHINGEVWYLEARKAL